VTVTASQVGDALYNAAPTVSQVFTVVTTSSPLPMPIISANPFLPNANGSVTITYNASLGQNGLNNFTGPVYIHAGVLTSAGSTVWAYQKADWAVNTSPDIITTRSESDPNIYTITIDNIRQYFGVPNDVYIDRIAFVFRNADGTLVGKDSGDKDFYITVSPTNNLFTPTTVTVTIFDATRAFGASNPTFQYEVVGVEEGDEYVVNVLPQATNNSAVGQYPISALVTFLNNKAYKYIVNVVPGTLTITKATPSLSGFNLSSTYDINESSVITFSGITSTNSTIPVVVTVIGPAVLLSNNTISLTGVGLVELVATQAGNNNYEAAQPVSFIFSVINSGTSIKNSVFSSVNIYPVPNSGHFNIDTDSNLDYSVIDNTGIVVSSGQLIKGNNKLSLNLLPGLYIIKVGISTHRLVIH
jgi:hypothetical protein